MKIQRAFHKLSLWAAAGALVLASAACSTDSPSEPSPTVRPPGSGGGATATYNVTVSAAPSVVPVGSTDPVLITVRAQEPGGANAPNGTLAQLSTLFGTFEGGPGVGSDTLTVQLTNGRAQVRYFAPASVGDTVSGATITATVAGSVGRTTVRFAEEDVLFIGSVQPSSGSPQGGETVTIQGSGFEAPARVTFGGLNAQVLSVSPNSIRVRTPASPAPANEVIQVAVGVTINVNQAEQASDTLNNAFTFAPGGDVQQPTILSVTPASGPNEGGTRVTIRGSGFQAPVQVEFGAGGTFVEAEVESVSSDRIIVRTPAATGFGNALRNQSTDIRVRNIDSGLTFLSTAAFRYGTTMLISAVSPNSGAYFGGETVTIFGQGFDAPVEVNVGGVEQEVLSVTGTEIVFRTVSPVLASCSDFRGPVEVTNIASGVTAAGQSFTFLVRGFEPVIFRVDPSSGPQSGGTDVSAEGENLVDPVVTVGGRPAAIVGTPPADGSSVTFDTPFLPLSSFAVEACDDNADGTSGERYLPTSVDVKVENRATTCSATFPEGFTYNPSNTSCRNDDGPTEPAPTECTDGFDNDGDTLIDAADPECTGPDDDDESA